MPTGLTEGTVVDPRVILVDVAVGIQHLAAVLFPIGYESLLLWPYQMGMEEGNDRYSSQIKLQVAVTLCLRVGKRYLWRISPTRSEH